MTEFNLSEKMFYTEIGFDKDINMELGWQIRSDDVKEFIRLCEDNSEEINNTSYIKVSKMQKFAGDKLIKMTTQIPNKLKEGCGKRTNFKGNGLHYNRPICSHGNLCNECKNKILEGGK